MLKFDLKNGYYIRNLDKNNWVVVKVTITKTGKDIGAVYEKVEAYCYDLQHAWYHAIRLKVANANSKSDLKKIIDQLNTLELKFEALDARTAMIDAERTQLSSEGVETI